jgi:hypothetical protein
MAFHHIVRRVRGSVIFLALLVLLAAPAVASAVSLRDLVELVKAGVGDEVLIALIAADDTRYSLQPADILDLKRSGVSDRVIVALLKNGRPNVDAHSGVQHFNPRPPEPLFNPQPPVPVPVPVDNRWAVPQASPVLEQGFVAPITTATPSIVNVATANPSVVVVVPWVPTVVTPVAPGRRGPARPYLDGYRGFGRFINDGWVDNQRPRD